MIEKFIALQEDHLEFFLVDPNALVTKDKSTVDLMAKFEHNFQALTDPLEKAILKNHYCNCQLWGYEDKARDLKAKDSTIANVKRIIDKLNQQRNDQIEIINNKLIQILPHMNTDSPLFSETPGSLLDRISITLLKIYHMNLAAKQESLPDLASQCQQKARVLRIQKQDLFLALNHMIESISMGIMHFRQYKQYKMYNDKKLNPYLKEAPVNKLLQNTNP